MATTVTIYRLCVDGDMENTQSTYSLQYVLNKCNRRKLW